MDKGRIKPWLRRYEEITERHFESDVVVCGYGGAGASAALEARRAKAEHHCAHVLPYAQPYGSTVFTPVFAAILRGECRPAFLWIRK